MLKLMNIGSPIKDFEDKGVVLAGIFNDPLHMKRLLELLAEIDEIVEEDLKNVSGDVWKISNHWIVFNHEGCYWGVYYKEGHECVISARNEKFITFMNK
ncbi:hypothetical protein PPK13_gp48 [Bacillus phage Ray17]|uniref:Uncharacterized protein n=1 Tax=Bacillus phage Ray17 TaxID=2315627 RepID=A0A386K9L9_9CAUD|nr:hypothetical protein PPK13_gp48 [Bacillus phage Ray17]AYD80950.1 hypothetical protein Ray17_49 [Bacillus phage Ray17]